MKEKGPCPLCRGERLRRVYTHATGLPLMRCTHCGLLFFAFPAAEGGPDYWTTGVSRRNIEVYTDPGVIKELERLYSRYLDWLETMSDRKPGRLIDYGCGIGNFVEFARARGWEAYGLDTSEAAVQQAQARGLPVWSVAAWGTGARLPREVDVVTMLDVIEHLDEPARALEFVSGALRDGGILLVETPAADYLPRRVSLWLARLSRGRLDLARFFFYPDHRVYFDLETLKQLLEGCGFRVLWARRVTSSRAKIMRKLQVVHRASRLLRALAWVVLRVTGLLGGNKIVVCARLYK